MFSIFFYKYSLVIEKFSKEQKLDAYAYDGDKNLYTVNAIDLSQTTNSSVGLSFIAMQAINRFL